MEQIQITDGIKRILSVSFILILISTFVIVFMGYSLKSIHGDIMHLDKFLINSKDIQTNFEQSLMIYTERTQKITNYLFSLRPDSEEKYIKFISDVEDLGQKLNLDLNMQFINNIKDKADINYSIELFSNTKNLEKFLSELQTLPYFIKITNIEFTDPDLYLSQENSREGNVKLKIKLYTK